MKKLIFVYNAKSDIINSAFDFAHKIISPNTYACNLCKLTHGNYGEKKEWKEFRKNTDLEMEFLHIDEFEEKYSATYTYPIILTSESNTLTPFIKNEELSNIKELRGLISLLKENS